VAGGRPSSKDITSITPGKRCSFEKIGDIPGEGRYCVSTILIGERFVLGFGGWRDVDIDEMWIFDLQTKKASPVTKEGNWHPGGWWPALVVRDKELYVIGGGATIAAHCLSFLALSNLIERDRIRSAFCFCLSLPLLPNKRLERRTFRHYIPLPL